MASTEIINLRVPVAHKAIIDSAAILLGKNRTAFILENAVRSAEELLMERTHFRLSDDAWGAFNAALDAPAQANTALDSLLSMPAPWESTRSTSKSGRFLL